MKAIHLYRTTAICRRCSTHLAFSEPVASKTNSKVFLVCVCNGRSQTLGKWVGGWMDGHSLLVEEYRQSNRSLTTKLLVNGQVVAFLQGDWQLDDLQVSVQSSLVGLGLVCENSAVAEASIYLV